ncbi:PLP-dependent aminotransferase family protein [Neisseriaceae bacterium TC5R-5]|nr:PLP-dependent aminotransferase family protein [Neisseriaceae bacterium TC5R-5]
MTNFTCSLNNGTTLVESIVNSATTAIQSGQWQAESKIPSIRRMAAQLDVSPFTVVEAYDRLVSMGYIQARAGSGFFVETRYPVNSQAKQSTQRSWPVDESWLLHKVYQLCPQTLLAGCGWLPAHWYDLKAQQKALRRLGRQQHSIIQDYGHPKGYPPLRQHLAHRLQENNINTTAEHILLTQGASRALDMVIGALLQTGDMVLVDDPGYCNLLSCLAFRGLKLLPVPWTTHGPDLEKLETLLQTHRPKVFFTNPWLQNPTGASYSTGTAHRVLKLAEQYDLLVVEDNVSGDFTSGRQPTLSALDDLNRVIYIDSFSKTLSPSLRVGYLCCALDILEKITHYKMISGLSSAELNERLVLELISEGGYRHQLEKLRIRLAEAQAFCQRQFLTLGWQLFAQPSNGMFLLARPPQALDTVQLTELAQKQQILLAPGHLFSADLKTSNWLRFNVAFSQEPRLWEYLKEVTS